MSPYCIPDDPIIRCMERTGEPPWQVYPYKQPKQYCFGEYAEWEEDDGDVFYGNETEEF